MIPVWLQMANIIPINLYNFCLKIFNRSSLKGGRPSSKSTASYGRRKDFFFLNEWMIKSQKKSYILISEVGTEIMKIIYTETWLWLNIINLPYFNYIAMLIKLVLFLIFQKYGR